jgi:hypothetical protein
MAEDETEVPKRRWAWRYRGVSFVDWWVAFNFIQEFCSFITLGLYLTEQGTVAIIAPTDVVRLRIVIRVVGGRWFHSPRCAMPRATFALVSFISFHFQLWSILFWGGYLPYGEPTYSQMEKKNRASIMFLGWVQKNPLYT